MSRSSPGESRESQAVECEKLGKRVRKKRKIYMDSGDEEEDNNQEEEEVSRNYVVQQAMMLNAPFEFLFVLFTFFR